MSVNERVAVLESQQSAMKTELDSMDAKLDSINDSLDKLNLSFSRQRGFWAGVAFMASAIGFGLAQVWSVFRGGS